MPPSKPRLTDRGLLAESFGRRPHTVTLREEKEPGLFSTGPYILLGQAYAKKGQPATAEGMLRRAIQYDPNNRTAHYVLAQLLQQLGRHEEAKAEFAIAERLQGQPGR